MALPLIIAGGLISKTIDVALSPGVNWIAADGTSDNFASAQNGWRRRPILPPSPTTILDIFNRGMINEPLAHTLLRNQGISWYGPRGENARGSPNTPTARNNEQAWRQIGLAMQDQPSTAFIMGVWSRGYWEPGSVAARAAIKRAGGNADIWPQFVSAMYEIPSAGDLLVMRNRGYLTADQLDDKLKRLGFGHELDRRNIAALRNASPGAVDLIHFAVKEAFSTDVANRVQLYDEYPHVITPYMRDIGLDWPMDFNITADGIERQATIGDMHWAAHWQPISPSQTFDLYHILRPERLARYAALGLNVDTFGLDDVRRWLRINDYPPSVRDQLAALSFTPLRLVDIRQALTLNWRLANESGFADVIPVALQARIRRYNRAWGVAQFRDRGVLPDDADTQVDTVYAMAATALAAPARSATRSAVRAAMRAVIKSYTIGIVPRDRALRGLIDVGLTEPAANTYLDIADNESRIQLANTAIRTLRKALLTGRLSAEEAIAQLQQAGVTEDRTRYLVRVWIAEFDFSRRQASTAQIVDWTAKGRIPTAEAVRRLENIGWTNPDVMLLMADAQAKSQVLMATATKAADSANRKRNADLTKALKQAQANVKELQQAVRRTTPVATWQRMYRKALITHDRFVLRMMEMGFDRPTAELYATDATKKDAPKDSPPQQPSKQPSSAGTASTPSVGQQSLAAMGLNPVASQPPSYEQLVNDTQPQRLDTQPQRLNTQPNRLGPQPGGAGG